MKCHVLELVQRAGRSDLAEFAEARSGDALPGGRVELERAGIRVGNLGDAGEMLDDQARSTYRRRVCELREEFEEAKQFDHLEQAEQIEGEIEALTTELSRAVGLRRRSRRAASAAKRARQSVTHAIKTALERIGDGHPVLHESLSQAIGTGIYCRYEPEPDALISWGLGAAPQNRDGAVVDGESANAAQAEEAPQMPGNRSPATQFLSSQTGFVGRDAERLQLRALVDRAAGGQGALVMMAGGPGVGKSRLATETAAYAHSRGLRSFIGHCYEREEPYRYLPFAEIFETILAQSEPDGVPRRARRQCRRIRADCSAAAAHIHRYPAACRTSFATGRRLLFQSLVEYLARLANATPLIRDSG